MNFGNNLNNGLNRNLNNGLIRNINSERSEDLTKIFDRKYHANHDVNEKVQERKKDLNFKMFGIRDKEEVRQEMREANTVDAKVERLKERTDFTNNHLNDKL